MRAYIYMLRRVYKGARLDYQRLLEIDPKNYNGRLGLATLEQKENKFREALDILNQLLVEFPEDAVLYVARARCGAGYNMMILHWSIWTRPFAWHPTRSMPICCGVTFISIRKRNRWQKRTSKKLFRWECLLPMFTNRCNNANNPEK